MAHVHSGLRRVVAGLVAVACAATLWAADNTPSSKDDQSPATRMDRDHRIAPLEIIVVDVFGEKDLSRECVVQASGKISFPLLGEIEVAGKTTIEVEKVLKELLGADYLVNPQLSVSVRQYRLRTVNVLGEVNRPGFIELKGEQKWTVLDAIGQAGSFTRNARISHIEFTRQGRKQTLSYDDLSKTTDASKIIYLEPGDTIRIPQTWY